MIPVVIVHIGDSSYLRDVVEVNSAKNHVILIGCEKNAYIGELPNVQHINYTRYLDSYVDHLRNNFYELEKGIDTNEIIQVLPDYLCQNSAAYLFIWILRVYFVKKLMEELNIPIVYHTDSDCFVVDNVTKIANILGNKTALTVEHIHNDIHMVASIHNAFLTPDFCTAFFQLYEDVYVNKTKRYLLKTKADAISSGRAGGNICDMNFYYLLWKEKLVDIIDLTMPFDYEGEQCVFDLNIKNSGGFEGIHTYKMTMDEKGHRKHLLVEDGKIYQETQSGKYIRLLSLHFNDSAKDRISSLKHLFLDTSNKN